MTQAQMEWNLRKGLAWFQGRGTEEWYGDWRMPIWTKDGRWAWCPPCAEEPSGHYELVEI
jgi:hypothetical protein